MTHLTLPSTKLRWRAACPRANASIPWVIRSTSASPSAKAPITAWWGTATTSASTSPARSIPAVTVGPPLMPGLSGGPTVTADGLIVGINVATRRGGQLVSFLVPARFAAALLQRVREHEMPSDLHAEIARQLAAWQSGLYKSFGGEGFRSTTVGPYRAPETMAPWFDCWAQTNAGATPKPRASINSTNCASDTG